MDISNNIAVVTGGASGIGRATVRRLVPPCSLMRNLGHGRMTVSAPELFEDGCLYVADD